MFVFEGAGGGGGGRRGAGVKPRLQRAARRVGRAVRGVFNRLRAGAGALRTRLRGR